jgi:hypothetical protein
MEVNIMKKLVISSILVPAVLIFCWSAFGQPEEGAGQRERFESMRQRWENMSEEEREKARAEVRERAASRGLGREGQLKAIALIEEQVAKLKAAVESVGRGRERYRNMSEEERTEYRKKMAQAARTRQQTIEEIEQQLSKLKFREQRQQSEEPQMRVKELQEIQQLAVKEKATETAERLKSFIAQYQQRQSRAPGMRPRMRESRREGESGPRPRQPRMEEDQ